MRVKALHTDWKEHPDRPRSWLLRVGPVLFAFRRLVGNVSFSIRWKNYGSGAGYWPDR